MRNENISKTGLVKVYERKQQLKEIRNTKLERKYKRVKLRGNTVAKEKSNVKGNFVSVLISVSVDGSITWGRNKYGRTDFNL